MAQITLLKDAAGLIRLQSHGKAQASLLTSMYDNAASLFDVSLTGGITPGNGARAADHLPPIRAHKAVLAQASSHLRDSFTSQGFLDSNNSKHTILEIGHETLRKIVKFIYTDDLEMQDDDAAVENVRGILAGAKYLLMTDLAEACETFLAGTDRLNAHNCIDTFQFAYKYDCTKLLEAACAFIAGNLLAISQSTKFLELAQDECATFLLSEPVVATRADDRCRAAIAWLSHKSPSRAESAECIMSMAALDAEGVSLDTLMMAAQNAVIRPIIKGVSLALVNALTSNIQQQQTALREAWYVIGGQEESSFYRYDVAQRRWTLLQALPWKRSGNACAVGPRLFVADTYTGKQNGVFLAVDEYDTVAQTWSASGAKLHGKYERAGVAVAADNESVYVFGGTSHGEIADRYCLNTRKVQKLANMGPPRHAATAACFESGVVFVAGGINGGVEYCPNVDKYDYACNSWSTINNLKTPRSHLAATFMGDDFYIVGGDADGACKKVEILNARTGQLRKGRKLIHSRAGCAAVPLDQNVVCVLGGSNDDDGELCSVETFDVREGKWSIGSIVPDMPIKNADFGFARVFL